MTNDALDPGPLGNYPHWPRRPDGSLDPARMPTGITRVRRGGKVYVIDQTPRTPTGEPIEPPPLPPPPGGNP
jgi:hypothetical protein